MVTKKQWKVTFLVEDTAHNFENGEPMDLRDEDDMKDTLMDIQKFVERICDFKVVDSDVEEVKK